MAYSKLAGLPVQYGLYTSFIGALCYWVFGTSKDINIGPVAVASIVTGAILSDVANEHPAETREVLAGIISMLAGGVIFAVGLLRLGWLVDLLSLPAVSAFITGSAITITFSQIPVMMGMRGISGRDPAFFIGLNILKHLDRIRIDAALGLTSLAMLYIIKWMCSSVAIKRPKMAKAIFFVSTLRTVFTLLLYTFISYLVNRTRKDDPLFRVLGFIPSG
jgi:solute carrier family 26 (sodium-independent sulfate anion transporter), member 11